MPKVLLAKPGLDGHNRGVRVVMRSLLEAGCEVIYLGIRRTPEAIASAAVEEDVDVVGLSLLSGAHLSLCRDVLAALAEAGSDAPVVVGGVIPVEDHEDLKEMGISAVFTPGARLGDIEGEVRRLTVQHRGRNSAIG